MSEILQELLQQLLNALRTLRDDAHYDRHLVSIKHAIELTECFIDSSEMPEEQFEQLKRLMNDSLPWEDDLLEVWNKIGRQARIMDR